MELTENTDFETLKGAFLGAIEYGKRSITSPKIMRLLKNGRSHIYHRINTPDKIPVVYLFNNFSNRISYNVLLVLKGSEGDSFADYDLPTDEILIIHSHAINRYIERHGFEGSLGDCQKHIVIGTEAQSVVCDEYTTERKVYFDGGCFIGYQDGRICHFKTFVMNRQLYANQRMESLKSEKRKNAIMNTGAKLIVNADNVIR